jgi:DNA-binding XRE family transcriptional regulator
LQQKKTKKVDICRKKRYIVEKGGYVMENPRLTVRSRNPQIAVRVRLLRKQHGLTQRVLAMQAGVATDTLVRLEQGHSVSLDVLERIAAALATTVHDLSAPLIFVGEDSP